MTQEQLLKRFRQVFWSFKPEDYENPVTKASILEAITNIKRSLNELS